MAVMLRVPAASLSLDALLDALLGVPGAGKDRRSDEARRSALLRLVATIVLLDTVASMDSPMHVSTPPLMMAASRHKSTSALLQQLQKICLAKQGDVCIRLRRLGPQLGYTQPPVASSMLSATSLLPAALVADLADGALLVRCVRLVQPRAAAELARQLHYPARNALHKTHNVQLILAALAASGVPTEAVSQKALAAADARVATELLWAVAENVLLPYLSPEPLVRAECHQLCLRGTSASGGVATRLVLPPSCQLALPGAVHGVLPVSSLVETAGPDGALLLWMRTAARAAGLQEGAAAALGWSSVFGWSGAALTAVLRAYDEPEATLRRPYLAETLAAIAANGVDADEEASRRATVTASAML